MLGASNSTRSPATNACCPRDLVGAFPVRVCMARRFLARATPASSFRSLGPTPTGLTTVTVVVPHGKASRKRWPPRLGRDLATAANLETPPRSRDHLHPPLTLAGPWRSCDAWSRPGGCSSWVTEQDQSGAARPVGGLRITHQACSGDAFQSRHRSR